MGLQVVQRISIQPSAFVSKKSLLRENQIRYFGESERKEKVKSVSVIET